MPSSFTPDQISKIKSTIPSPTHKILAAAASKLYIAHPNPHHWTYTGLSGAIVLTNHIQDDTLYFKLVDVFGEGKVLWDFELWSGFVYVMDLPWFHSFEMDGCMAGLSFGDEGEGRRFYRKVMAVIGGRGMFAFCLDYVDCVDVPRLWLSQDQSVGMARPARSRSQEPGRMTRISEPRQLKHVSMIMASEHGYTVISNSATGTTGKLLSALDRRGFHTDIVDYQKTSGQSSEVEQYWTKALTDMQRQRTGSTKEDTLPSRAGVPKHSSHTTLNHNAAEPPVLPPRPLNREITPPSPPRPETAIPSTTPSGPLHAPPSSPERINTSLGEQLEVSPDDSAPLILSSPLISNESSPPPPPPPPPPPSRALLAIPPPSLAPRNTSLTSRAIESSGRNALLASIRASGGIGALRKVNAWFFRADL